MRRYPDLREVMASLSQATPLPPPPKPVLRAHSIPKERKGSGRVPYQYDGVCYHRLIHIPVKARMVVAALSRGPCSIAFMCTIARVKSKHTAFSYARELEQDGRIVRVSQEGRRPILYDHPWRIHK